MPERKRAKRIIAEVSDKDFELVKEEARVQNITVRVLILRLVMPEIYKRKELRGGK